MDPSDQIPEWLETDGTGGFAMGPIHGPRTRRYHSLLTTSDGGIAGRRVCVVGHDAWLEIAGRTVPLTTQAWRGGLRHPDAESYFRGFQAEPWPTIDLEPAPGLRVRHEIFMVHGASATVLRWRLEGASSDATLHLRLFLSGRDYHQLESSANPDGFDAQAEGHHLRLRLRSGAPDLLAIHDGQFRAESHWYRGFHYSEEAARGFDSSEDAAVPGVLALPFESGEACLVIVREDHAPRILGGEVGAAALVAKLDQQERTRRARFSSPLHRAADAYIVETAGGPTIVAGYPWFTDWGRDTFISLSGLTLATGRAKLAGEILARWAKTQDQGMIPNRFVDAGGDPEFNSVDASLWFLVAAEQWKQATVGTPDDDAILRRELDLASERLIAAFTSGARYGIRVDRDGLLYAGVPGTQLTWMDAKVGDEVITARIGKPVEIQALWLRVLAATAPRSSDVASLFRQAQASFLEKFTPTSDGGLPDVLDVDGHPGARDDSLRPNQVLAIPWLPPSLARSALAAVERTLLTPFGLRTLAEADPRHVPHYRGGPSERDRSYHQGPVWPWLIGPWIDAWLHVHGSEPSAQSQAHSRFLSPLQSWLSTHHLSHLPELFDSAPPHHPRGAPFQAWSLAEYLRASRALGASCSIER